MRYPANHNIVVKRRLVAEASVALRALGSSGATVASIMGGIGLTHGGFYKYFSSKEDLLAEAIDLMFDESVAAYARLTEGVAPDEGLKRYAEFYLSREHGEARDKGCAAPAIAGEVSRMDDDARERFGRGLAKLHRAIAVDIAACGVDEADAMDIAASLVSELSGAIVLSRAVGIEAADGIRQRSMREVSHRLKVLAARQQQDLLRRRALS